jgi:hypothetical protein
LEKNVGGIFTVVRIFTGIFLIGLSVLGTYLGVSFYSFLGTMVALVLLMGGGLLMTGIFQRCPINLALDRDTCR